jgi:hypothetical protein
MSEKALIVRLLQLLAELAIELLELDCTRLRQ